MVFLPGKNNFSEITPGVEVQILILRNDFSSFLINIFESTIFIVGVDDFIMHSYTSYFPIFSIGIWNLHYLPSFMNPSLNILGIINSEAGLLALIRTFDINFSPIIMMESSKLF